MSTGLPDAAVRVRTFRLILVLAQRMRNLMDQHMAADGLTTQQATLITVVDALGTPTLSQAAAAMGSTHQNARQIAAALQRKDFLTVEPDPADRRALRLRTTERSARYWAGRSADDQQYVQGWFADLAPDEARVLFDLLVRVRDRTR